MNHDEVPEVVKDKSLLESVGVENPRGVATLWLAVAVALVAVLQYVFEWDNTLVALINVLLAAILAAVGETVRRL